MCCVEGTIVHVQGQSDFMCSKINVMMFSIISHYVRFQNIILCLNPDRIELKCRLEVYVTAEYRIIGELIQSPSIEKKAVSN